MHGGISRFSVYPVEEPALGHSQVFTKDLANWTLMCPADDGV
jgi:hypothetical protein